MCLHNLLGSIMDIVATTFVYDVFQIPNLTYDLNPQQLCVNFITTTQLKNYYKIAITDTSSPLPACHRQVASINSPQVTARQLNVANSLQRKLAAGGWRESQAGEQAEGQSTEWWRQWPGASHFPIPCCHCCGHLTEL